MIVEVLYFDDCPGWQTALENLKAVLAASGVETSIELTRVETEEDATRQRFTGSPSIRVDGQDLFPVESADFALSCRVYATPEGLRPAPTKEMLQEALREFIQDISN